MKYVNFFFHIYQPPLQDGQIVEQIVRESYEPLTSLIEQYSDLKFTININYSLVELLYEAAPRVLSHIRTAHRNGSLELTATGAYHPTFPLIPLNEVEKQIAINQSGNQTLLSADFHPDGIFPPEMAFDGRLVPLFESLGYKWTIADDSNMHHYGAEVPHDKIYTFDGLAVFLRSNLWSNQFAQYDDQHPRWQHGKDAVEALCQGVESWMNHDDGYLIIALDGETFGHHHKSLGGKFLPEFFKALRSQKKRIQTAHLSDIYQLFPHVSHFIPPGSWSTDEDAIAHQDYFSWWKSERNKIHRLQWRFTNFVLDKVRLIGDDEINEEMDRALYSCQYWWASFWKFNPDEIYKGAFKQMEILQKAADLLDDDYEQIAEGEALFQQLVTEVEKKRHHAED